MKPIPAILSSEKNIPELFKTKEIKLPVFSGEFHFHEDCQLVYIVKSSGKRIIGDLVDYFESGELIFLGSNIPHVWHNTTATSEVKEINLSHSLALYFNPGRLIEHLSAFEKVYNLESFLMMSQRGVKFEGSSKAAIIKLLYLIINQDGLEKIITFLKIIDQMISATNYRLLASINYINYYQYQDNKRMDLVFKYIFDNFRSEISLNTISEIAAMNRHAFCRYFKTRTQKSFVEFVNEMRIGYACKMLNDTDESISYVAYESGFSNLSNFNRAFKRLNKISPREYKRRLK